MDRNDNTRFEETQAFAGWGYGVLAVSGLAPLVLTAATGSRVGPGLGLGLLPVLALTANLLCMKTTVDEAAVTVTFGWGFPMYRRRITRADILRAQVVTYSPLVEYGGWGIRGLGENTALNARGNRGVRLFLTGGKRVLIGSQRPEALAEALG